MYNFLPPSLYLQNPFEMLPFELLIKIFGNLHGSTLIICLKVSHHWRDVILNERALRDKLKKVLAEERRKHVTFVKRESLSRMFLANVAKTVHFRQSNELFRICVEKSQRDYNSLVLRSKSGKCGLRI